LMSSRPAVVSYWTRRRRERDGGQTRLESQPREEHGLPAQLTAAQCLVTGKLCVPVRLHPRSRAFHLFPTRKGVFRLRRSTLKLSTPMSWGRSGMPRSALKRRTPTRKPSTDC
jgi:hypothetical protein